VLALLLSLVVAAALISILVVPLIVSILKLDSVAGSLISASRWILLFVLISVIFGITYKHGPNIATNRRRIVPGSVIASGLFLIASAVFQGYVANFASYEKIYGSIGGVIVFLLWIWLSSACLLLGCVFNKALDANSPVGPKGAGKPLVLQSK
jgi:membrane protein